MSEIVNVVILKSTWPIESASPACLKLLAWLEMAGLEYVASAPKLGPKSDTGKAPYIVLEDGQIIADSQRVIEYLSEKHNIQMDAHLSDEERAQSLCLRRLFEDHYYFCGSYHRWILEFDLIRKAYFSTMPFFLKSIIPPMLQRQVKRDLAGQGTGKRPYPEIVQEAKDDIDAMSILLGTKDYFFGEPSSIDAVAFAFLENTINVPLESEFISYAKEKENLVAFCKRFRARYFA